MKCEIDWKRWGRVIGTMYEKDGEGEGKGENDMIRITDEEVEIDDFVACCIDIKGEEPID